MPHGKLMSLLQSLFEKDLIAPSNFDCFTDSTIANGSILVPLSEALLTFAYFHARKNLQADVETILSDQYLPIPLPLSATY